MNKRNEKNERMTTRESIDYSKLIEDLDWTGEISPVMLVKAANSVSGCSKKLFRVNETSFYSLVKDFDSIVGKFVTIRFVGKDKFYKLKPEYNKEQLVHYVRTGVLLDGKEIYEKIKKEPEKQYIPEEIKKTIKRKRASAMDDESIAKLIIYLVMAEKQKGEVKISQATELIVSLGFKKQRSISGSPKTSFQEICMVSGELDLPSFVKTGKSLAKFDGGLEKIPSIIDDLKALIEDEEMKGIITNYMNSALSSRKDIKIEEKPKADEKNKVIITSPASGTFKETEVTSHRAGDSISFESVKNRWYKGLIAETLLRNPASTRGMAFSFLDISQTIKRERFVELHPNEVKNLMFEIRSQVEFKGLFREINPRGFTIGSDSLIKSLYEFYNPAKISEKIFVRLKMSLKQVQESYRLQVELASEISEFDNIYCITANRSESSERSLAKLIFCMRPGEALLVSDTNTSIKRAKFLIEKLGLNNLC